MAVMAGESPFVGEVVTWDVRREGDGGSPLDAPTPQASDRAVV